MVPQSVVASLAVAALVGVIECALACETVLVSSVVCVIVPLSGMVSVLCLYLQLCRQFSVNLCL